MGFFSGGFGTIGGIASSALGVFGQHQANQANLAMSREQRDWSERMSNTAHQREIKDLREAGLNPILSGFGGSGASVGGYSNIASQNMFADVSSDYSSARAHYDVDKERVKIERELKDATTERERTASDLNRSQIGLNSTQDNLLNEQARLAAANILKVNQDTLTSSESAKTYATQQALNLATAKERLASAGAHSAQEMNIRADTLLKNIDQWAPKRLPGNIVRHLTPPVNSDGKRVRESTWYDQVVDWQVNQTKKLYNKFRR